MGKERNRFEKFFLDEILPIKERSIVMACA
jgi:hypothetical protein